jgi:hydrogenase expression/formation protein HypC
MCLGIPGKVLDVHDEDGLRMGRVDFGGVRRDACLSYLPEVVPGDYVIVHVGFAISRLDEAEAMETLDLLREIGAVEQELATLDPGMDAPALVGEAGDGAHGAILPASPEPARARVTTPAGTST